MKKTYSILCAFVLAGSLFGCSTTQQKTGETDYTQYVNTFIGAADNGHTFPGACRPFGMIQTSPVTGAVGWRYCSEYVYTDSLIWGFTQARARVPVTGITRMSPRPRHTLMEQGVWTWETSW